MTGASTAAPASRRGRLKLALRVLVSVGVLGLLLLLLPWDEVKAAVGRMPAAVWAAVLAGFLVGHRLGVTKWRLMVNGGRGGLGRRDAVRCYAAGLFANLCLPSIVGGDVLRAALAARATGRGEAAVLGGIGDRLSDVLALSLLLAGGALAARDALPEWGAATVTAVLVVGLGGLAVATWWLLSRRLRDWPARFRRPVGRALVALRRLARRPRTAAAVFLLSLAIQTGFVLLNAWIGRALGIDLPLGVWFLAWPLAKVAGLLPVSLGGLGVRDAALGAILAPMGVPMATGVVASLVWQSVLIAGGLLAGGVWLALGRRGGKAPEEDAPTEAGDAVDDGAPAAAAPPSARSGEVGAGPRAERGRVA